MSTTGLIGRREVQGSRDRTTALWLGTRVYVAVVSIAAIVVTTRVSPSFETFVTSWHQFDTYCYESIVDAGYLGSDRCTYNTAFFPGLPGLMWLGTKVGLSVTLTGLLVSLAASWFAAKALATLARDWGASSNVTVATWLIAPMAVFLFAPYTEALFSALSFWAWVWAQRGHWIAAGALAGVAGLVRSNALFLGVALGVLFLLSRPRPWAQSWALALPFLTVAAFFAYLYAITGSWTHWFDVQAATWNRQFTDPITSAWNTLQLGLGAPENGFTSSRFYAELLNTALVLAAGIVLLVKRRWPEAIYVLLTIWSFMTGEFFQSTPRATLVLFPVWLVLGAVLTKHRWMRWGYFTMAPLALAFVTVRYVDAQWIS